MLRCSMFNESYVVFRVALNAPFVEMPWSSNGKQTPFRRLQELKPEGSSLFLQPHFPFHLQLDLVYSFSSGASCEMVQKLEMRT